jgi:hypothetical protein
LGEDVFIKGIRKGVEQGEYVYQRGELLYGPGDPITVVAIDEQAVVLTMAYAKEHGKWPRPAAQGTATPTGFADDGTSSGRVGHLAGGRAGGASPALDGGEIAFAEGLGLNGDAPEKLTEQLTRFATGSAYVEAIAEAKA